MILLFTTLWKSIILYLLLQTPCEHYQDQSNQVKMAVNEPNQGGHSDALKPNEIFEAMLKYCNEALREERKYFSDCLRTEREHTKK